MKQCRGCGAFFEKKCPYCGYKESESDIIIDGKLSTLIIYGDMNECAIIHDSDESKIFEINGDMQKNIIHSTKYINIEIHGDMNRVVVNKPIIYASIIKGDMNRII
jgi:hypothetical protein